jgi:hypothetical protein
VKKQKGLATAEYVIGASLLVLVIWMVISGGATALINKLTTVMSAL